MNRVDFSKPTLWLVMFVSLPFSDYCENYIGVISMFIIMYTYVNAKYIRHTRYSLYDVNFDELIKDTIQEVQQSVREAT